MMSDMKGIVVSQTSHLLYKQMFDLRQAELAATNHVMTTGGPRFAFISKTRNSVHGKL
jgi:hypothetical protein